MTPMMVLLVCFGPTLLAVISTLVHGAWQLFYLREGGRGLFSGAGVWSAENFTPGQGQAIHRRFKLSFVAMIATMLVGMAAMGVVNQRSASTVQNP